MGEQNHTGLLRLQVADLSGRTPFCPEDQVIADYYDGGLAGGERDALERHLGECRHCRARVGVIERLERQSRDRRIPESILAQAKKMASPAIRRHYRMAPAWAAAAVLVIAMAGIISNRQNFTTRPDSPPAVQIPDDGDPRKLRSVDRNAIDLEVLAPTAGAHIAPGAVLRWVEVPQRLHYDITVLTENGDILLNRRLESSQWALDGTLPLEAGGKYYFRVEARLSDGRAVRSKHVEFRLKGQQ